MSDSEIIPLTGKLYEDEDPIVEADVVPGSHAEWDHPEEYVPEDAEDGPAAEPEPEPEPEPALPIPKVELGPKDMGKRLVARSASGTKVINTLEVLPPLEWSV